ncbi:hypothetical protein J4N45_14460 [Vibrio sp. SCSIO 43140]|uniref:hypothetical protein n=1 Tax=Vibrio sp. SCSIO 43140 TaxID=2819100 RepID=UPI0020755196|nr:hypothetical protein [Vibrio sp. SCSIO 43140]USD58809.1 hypothetical protein J4N45_09725 [Vibrio sp. SCSIO 43140]USD59143.1 hypothetical protein J4N45_11430 [Vibrio sp. SCSIO 43140]USD59704.1 hypothetical protein J4N45_14460 [Vibrio sp. SCSIO 43140]
MKLHNRLKETTENADIYFNLVDKVFTQELMESKCLKLEITGKDKLALASFLDYATWRGDFDAVSSIEELLEIDI